jgi:hypothetical protein
MKLSYLRPLYRRRGPWASVYLDASTDDAEAHERVGRSARAIAEELAAAGADTATRDAITTAILEHTGPGRHGVAVFAARGEVTLSRPLPEPPSTSVARWGRLPAVLPLLAGAGEQVRWLRVLVDRTGRDVLLSSGRVPATVRGAERYPIRQAQPGGWSQPRHQGAAQTNWERNAKEVAEAITHAVDETGAEIVVLAGGVRARQLLIEHLPPTIADLVLPTEAGSRAPGADPEPLDEATEQAVRDKIGRRHRQVLDAYRAGRPHGLAVAGRVAVRVPLAWSQVQTLLISPDLPDDPGDELVGAAATGDADVVVVPPGDEPLPEGVGAVLRYRVGPAPQGAGGVA